MASRLRALAALITLAGVFAGAWHLRLWLIVVAMAASAIALVVCERLGERALAQRAAAWALYAPEGITESSHLEHTVAADLATAALGDVKLLDYSIDHAHHTIADPWLRALATERLHLARDLVSSRELPPPPLALNLVASAAVRISAVAATFAFALAAAATRHHLLLVPLTASLVVVGVGYEERRRRAALPPVLCDEACTPSPHGLILIPEPSVAAALSALACSRKRVLATATALVSGGGAPQRDVALARLALAGRKAVDRPPPSLTATVLVWALVAAATIAVSEVL